MKPAPWIAIIVGLAACSGGDGAADPDATAVDAVAPDAAAPPPPLGTVTPLGACTLALPTLLAGARCEEVRVTCPGMADATARLLIGEPVGAAIRGTIVFGSGSSGATLMEQAATRPDGSNAFVSELEGLRRDGYRVIERAWQGGTGNPGGDDCAGAEGSFDVTVDRGWIRGTEGPDAAACRYATLTTYLHAQHDADGAYCAVGFSGGSLELAMILGRWQRAPLLDYALFVSGPAASFDASCLGSPASAATCAQLTAAQPWECRNGSVPACTLADNIRCLLDRSYAGAQVCTGSGADDAATLAGDSVLAPGAERTYPTTGLGVIVGLGDCASGAAITGADFASQITGATGAPTLDFIAGAGHTVHREAAGAAQLAARLRAGCAP